MMQNTTSRVYSDSNDLEAIIDALRKFRPAGRIAEYPGIDDLREMLFLPSIQARTRLWFNRKSQLGAENQLGAFAIVDAYSNLLFEFDRQALTPALEAEIIDWGVACMRQAAAGAGEPVTLDASCSAGDAERIAILKRHGFIEQTIQSVGLERSLDEPIPDPILPAGFSIQPSRGQAEIEEWVALHRAAHHTDHMTAEERLAMISGAEYDPELDLVAIAPDGRLAAYCMCGISQEENARTGRNAGYTDPIAAHPAYQGLGLARALLLTGLRLLKARGMDVAVMGTSSENIAMQRAARAVGFCQVSTKIWFARPV